MLPLQVQKARKLVIYRREAQLRPHILGQLACWPSAHQSDLHKFSGCWAEKKKRLSFFFLPPPHLSHSKHTRRILNSDSLPQSMTSAPVARICVMRTPSAPTPSEDTCVPASRATWETAPSAEVSSCPGTALQTHKHTRPLIQTPTFLHILWWWLNLCSITSLPVWFTPPSHHLAGPQLPRRWWKLIPD